MHGHSLSPVVLQHLLFLIWNIMADIICGYYLNSAPDKFCYLIILRFFAQCILFDDR